jgi:outer membrane protein OmpA-like peptidoglycan-associated protein
MNAMRLTFLLLIQIIGFNCYSQNLIANSSFEDVNICTEANAPCSPAAWKTTSPFIPNYGGDKLGKYVGITLFNSSLKEIRQYLQIKLLCPLQKDKEYKLSIKLKPEQVIIESIGVLFSDSALFYNSNRLIRRNPSIDFKDYYSSIPYNKRKMWTKIDVDYRAVGNEKYLIIGNFQSDSEQKRVFLSKETDFTNYNYDIDDVELIPIDTTDLCPDYKMNLEKLYSLHERHPLTKSNIFGEDDTQVKEIADNEIIDTIRLSSVFFEFDSFKITQRGKLRLDSLCNNLNRESIDFIKIYGYTDSIGEKDYNMALSYNRANSIKQVLIDNNLSDYITDVKGFGDLYPIASNSEEIGRSMNRRVEVIIKYKKLK